mgnify:CR=1 FL=1
MKAKKDDITHKLKIARGQIDGILQMIEEDRYCVDISTQLQSVQALLKSVNQQILQAHIRNCVREALQTDAENPKLEEALKLLEKMVIPGAERDSCLSAPNFVSDWIVNPAIRSVQKSPNFIYFRWLDVANE